MASLLFPDDQDMPPAETGLLGPGLVMAQGARGAVVPRATMMDSPQYLMLPDTGDEPVYKGVGPNAAETGFEAHQRQQALILEQMDQIQRQMAARPGHPDNQKLFDQFMALDARSKAGYRAGPVGKLLRREDAYERDSASGVRDMLEGADARRNAPRQSLPPPAPGGVPLGAPPAERLLIPMS